MATRTKDSDIAGPAPARPVSVAALPPFSNRSSTGALKADLPRKCSPAAAVPVTVKIPEPITAPIPSAIKLQTPSVFFRARSGSSEEAISASILLQRKSWLMPPLLVSGLLVSGSRFQTAGNQKPGTRNQKRFYRFLCPLVNFFTRFFSDPRATPAARLGLGAAFFRDA